MPLNPFKRRKSSKGTVEADEPALRDNASLGSNNSPRPSIGEADRPSSLGSSNSGSQRPRMFMMGRRAPFGPNVKFKARAPPASASAAPSLAHSASPIGTPPISEHDAGHHDHGVEVITPPHSVTPQHASPHDEHEMVFADEPNRFVSSPLGSGDAATPETEKKKKKGSFLSNLFRRKSKNKKVAFDEGTVPPESEAGFTELGNVPTRGSEKNTKTKTRLTKKSKKKGALDEDPLALHDATRGESPPIDRLSIDPYHESNYAPEHVPTQDHPPPVIDLIRARSTSPNVRAPQPQFHDQYRAASPVFSEAGLGGRSRVRTAGITHALNDPESHGTYRASIRDDNQSIGNPVYTYNIDNPNPNEVRTVPGHVTLKPGDMYPMPSDRPVIFVVDEGVELEIGNPETGEFVPYDEAYIAQQAANRQSAYDETYYVPAGKIVEFRDENDKLIHRTGQPRSQRLDGTTMHENGMIGQYEPDGSYTINVRDTAAGLDMSHIGQRSRARVGGGSSIRSGMPFSAGGHPQSVREGHGSGSDMDARTVRSGAEGDHYPYHQESGNPSFVQPSYSDPYGSGGLLPQDSPPPHHGGSIDYSGGSGSPGGFGRAHHSPTHSINLIPDKIEQHFQGHLDDLASMFMMKPMRNTAWKANGPKDYARSAKKWNLQPTMYTAFFCDPLGLLRKTTGPEGGLYHNKAAGGAGAGGTKLTAEDVQNDLEYVVPVSVGTPGQIVKLDFDTGSADLWVWSSAIKATAANAKGHGIYHPHQSATAHHMQGYTWNITYGDGSGAHGEVYSDTVQFNKLSIKHQAVEAATHLDSTFMTEHGSDGLLGLAFPQINTVKPTKQKTPMENLIEQKLIAKPIFTVSLDKYGDQESFYTFGYIQDGVLPRGSHIAYVDVDSSNGFWEFSSPTMRIGNHSAKRPRGNTAIADTGTTLILLDDNTLDEIYGRVRGARMDSSGWILPTASRPEPMSFAVGPNFYTISGEDLKFADAGHGMSFGSIQSRGQNKQDIFGDVFLKRVYAVFDQTPGHPRLGLGQRTLRD